MRTDRSAAVTSASALARGELTPAEVAHFAAAQRWHRARLVVVVVLFVTALGFALHAAESDDRRPPPFVPGWTGS